MRLSKLAKITAWVFIVAGVLGFIPAFTSNGMLLGIFHVDGPHNWIHIITGLIAFRMSKKDSKTTRKFFQIAGLVYVALAVIGFFYGAKPLFNMIANNMADSWLHLIVGFAMTYIGYLHKGK